MSTSAGADGTGYATWGTVSGVPCRQSTTSHAALPCVGYDTASCRLPAHHFRHGHGPTAACPVSIETIQTPSRPSADHNHTDPHVGAPIAASASPGTEPARYRTIALVYLVSRRVLSHPLNNQALPPAGPTYGDGLCGVDFPDRPRDVRDHTRRFHRQWVLVNTRPSSTAAPASEICIRVDKPAFASPTTKSNDLPPAARTHVTCVPSRSMSSSAKTTACGRVKLDAGRSPSHRAVPERHTSWVGGHLIENQIQHSRRSTSAKCGVTPDNPHPPIGDTVVREQIVSFSRRHLFWFPIATKSSHSGNSSAVPRPCAPSGTPPCTSAHRQRFWV